MIGIGTVDKNAGGCKNSELSKYAMLLFLSIYFPRVETSQISVCTNIFKVTVYTKVKSIQNVHQYGQWMDGSMDN